VVDDYKAELWARVLPDISVHEDLAVATGRAVGWAVRHDARQLATALGRFTERTRAGTLLGNILFERYLRDERWVDDPTRRSERDKLRRYLSLFEKYGREYGFEPLALAAQAYQESRLDHSLRSPRGAVGLMQLLPSTAQDPNVGIPDIDDVENNVHAGARYLAFLRDRYFSDPGIDAWNRAALALAAYNAGPQRIRKARAQTARMGLDPDVWFDNVEVATGRQVGREPVRYVANIYKYYVAYRLLLDRRAQRSRASSS
jgi:membrane-bound lytic murein transglycosylase MltF